ncbi:sucrose-specific PTS transporter subunit IIBC [Streptococcus sp. Marseille-Q5855]|uniref:sucrose-specific PTS transporter subunit IIBC n=1 Tax=Streptococcus sp. Marseille-Q5855 TaxID=2972781 RepID=UPI0021C61A82|nr:sucrose-specific PTS transporter subunit IIBC [Streptococcus sp. Marseille-Q5855]
MAINYKKSAESILLAVGGKENIISTAHCATRLRLVLVDENVVNHEQLNAIDVVKGDFNNAGQFQIIIGSGTVNEVFKEFVKLVDIDEVSKAELKLEADKKLNPIQRAVKTLSDVFVPIIPALVASGLLMGINNILTAQSLFFENQSLVEAWPGISDLASMINTFASAAYAFLPVLIGFSATKIFGGNPYLGAALGMIMVSGDLLNAYGYGNAILNNEVPTWNILGLSIEKVGYQGTILPILVSSYILAKVESWLHKKIPEALDTLVTPMLSILMTAFITFLVVGGIMRTAGDIVTHGILWSRDTLGIFGGALFGFFYAPLTVTGMHHSLLPVDIQLIAKGGSFLFAIAACNNVSQGGAALMTSFLIKDANIKTVATSSGISALLGITEPAMFGVNLKLKYPFYGAMIGSAFGAAYVTLTNVLSVAPGAAGLLGFVSIKSTDIVNYIIGIFIALVVGACATFILSKNKKINSN